MDILHISFVLFNNILGVAACLYLDILHVFFNFIRQYFSRRCFPKTLDIFAILEEMTMPKEEWILHHVNTPI